MRKLVYTLMLLMPLTALGQIITDSDIKVDDFGSKKLKNAPKKVYFNNFSIGYQYLVEGSATGRDRNLKADVNMTAALVSELTEQDIQTITDNAYQKAEKRLTDAGFTIVSGEAAKDIKEYQKGVTQMTGGESIAANGYIYTAPTNKKFFVPDAKFSKAVDNVSKTSKGLGMLTTGIKGALDNGPDKSLGRISDELGNIIIIDFGMNIDFANLVEDMQMGGSSILKGDISLGANPYSSGIIWKGDGKLGNVESSIFLSSKNYKPFEIPGVIKKEKIRKTAAVEWKNDYTLNLRRAQSTKTTITNPVEANRELYIANVSKAVDEYLSIMINQLIDNVK